MYDNYKLNKIYLVKCNALNRDLLVLNKKVKIYHQYLDGQMACSKTLQTEVKFQQNKEKV